MSFTQYILKSQRGIILVALLLFGSLILVSIFKPTMHQSIAWLEAIAGFGTLVFAIFLWFNNLKQWWINELPKRITVYYRYEGRIVMSCKDSVLTNESDARTWALQIGQQMSGCQRLKFSPFFNFEDRGVQTNNDKSYRTYIFTYYLTEIPTPDAGTDEEKNLAKRALETGCVEYQPKYNDDGTITFEKGYYPSSSQTMNASA
jgi:hypothetical protein